MRVMRASGAEREEGNGGRKKDRQSSADAELARGRGRQRGRRSFREICRCAVGLRLVGVVGCAAAAALFSH